MKRHFILALALVCALSTVGCWDLRVLEDLSVVLALGVDLAPNGRDLLITCSEPEFTMPRSDDVRVSWTVAQNLGEALENIQLQASRQVAAGKVMLYLFGESFWRSGRIAEFARQTYARADLSLTGLVVCVRGEAGSVLSKRPLEMRQPAIFIRQMLSASKRAGLIPEVQMLRLARQWPPGEDLWIPLLKAEDKIDTITIDGSVVFRDTMPALILSLGETLDMSNIKATRPGHSVQVGLPTPEGAALDVSINSSKLKVKIEEGPEGRQIIWVSNQFGVTISSPLDVAVGLEQEIEDYTRAIASELTGRGQRALSRLQAVDSDPFGLTKPGAFTRPDKATLARQRYKDSDIRYEARVRVRAVGGE